LTLWSDTLTGANEFRFQKVITGAFSKGRKPSYRIRGTDNSRMQRYYSWEQWALIFLLATCTLCNTISTAQIKETRRVLVFSDFDSSSPAVGLILQEVYRTLEKKTPYQIDFYNEFLQTDLFPDETSQRKFRDWVVAKYRERQPDVIIAVGPAPVKFLAGSHGRLFRDIPLIFCGTTEEQADSPVLDIQFTGIWSSLEPQRTLEAALHLQPSTQHVFVVSGGSPYDKQSDTIVRENLRTIENGPQITYLSDMEMGALLERLKRLPENSVVLYATITQDAAGRHFVNSDQSLPMVAEAANSPVYVMSDALLGHGTVGGYVVNHAAQGQAVAESAIKILNGAKPEEIPIVMGDNRYMFDWRALRRWGLNDRILPKGSTVLYREPSIWQRYTRQIFISLFLFSLLLFFTAFLVEQTRRRSIEEEFNREARFERLISELSTYFIDLPVDEIQLGIDQTLRKLIEFLHVDRVSIFEFTNHKTELQLTHSCAVTTSVSAPPPARYATSSIPWYASTLLNNQTVVLTDLNQLPEIADTDRAFLRGRSVQSNVAVPLEAGGDVLGCLSFVTVYEKKLWPQRLVDQLQLIGQIFANALSRKRSDQARVGSEMLKSAILSSLSSGVAVLNQKGQIISLNSCWAEFARKIASESELGVGANYLEVCGRIAGGDPVIAEGLAGIEAVLHGEQHFEMEAPYHSSDQKEWFSLSVTPLRTSEGGAVVTYTDITKRKRAEREQEELSGRLINAQEQERSRLARELHDDFNQRLAILAIDLERAAQLIGSAPSKASERMLELWNRASEIGADLHSLSHSLHSSTLESLGLVLGVSAFCSEFAEQQGIQVDFAHEDIPRSIPPDVALCLFRIVQESLRNVKKHSGSSRAEVRLRGVDREIHLSVSDRGAGFEQSRLFRMGLGIRSMEERLRLIGGRLDIQSRPGAGTRIQVSVPLKANFKRAV
jgi:signal transduction histidine kinase/ABC-type uncharacterized transport system substrate-binding protein